METALRARRLSPRSSALWFQGWQWPNLNPCLHHRRTARELGAARRSCTRASHASSHASPIQTTSPATNFDAVRPYAFYFLPEWEHPQRKQYLAALLDWLLRQAPKPDVDGNHFFAYVRGPQTWTGQHIPDILNDRLDRLTAEQEADGGWPSPYSPAWRGWITIQNLLTLRAFGRV